MTTHPPIDKTGRAFTDDNGVAVAFTAFLHSRDTPPRLLGLGEPMHGEEEFPRLRNTVFRHLVEHEGYRSIALESDCVAGLIVDEFVAGGAGSLDDVVRRGFSYGFESSAANRDLVRWMREHNRDRPAAERVRFFGFDAPIEMTGPSGPREALTALHRYLADHVDAGLIPAAAATLDRLIGDDERWTNPEATMDPTRSVGSSADVATLRVLTDDLLTLLDSESPHLIAASYEDWWRARLYGRTAAGLLRYHAAMADTSESRVVRLMGLRDTMMADNLTAIVRHRAQPGPTLAFAHNRHLQKDHSRWLLPPGWGALQGRVLQWWCAGAIVGAQFGDEYAFVASAVGSARHQGLPAPQPDTLEGVLSTLPGNGSLVDAKRLATALGSGDTKLVPRSDTTGNYGYFALDPDELAGSDAILFVRDIADKTAADSDGPAQTPEAGAERPADGVGRPGLRVAGVEVASYVVEPEVDGRHGPRPYLHPVRTLGGVPVTDAQPEDHRWHLGVSVAMQDVDGVNLWGGRTYVRDQGYTWRDDHGLIAHAAWLPAEDGFAERLDWLDPAGRPLLREERAVAAGAVPRGWELSFEYRLTPAAGRDVTLGSPATNGRPEGAGYGGFFWRAAPGATSTFTERHDGEETVNGSAEPWVALTGPGPYTLVFRGLAGDDRWFVRTGGYPGVCAALAFERPLVVPAGGAVTRRLTVLIADGHLTRDEVRAYCAGER